MRSLLTACALVALGAALVAGLPASAKDAGKLPPDVVSLMNGTRVGGEFAVEVDASGNVTWIEAGIAVDDVPKVCRDAADKEVPEGKAVDGEKEWIDGTVYWEVVKEVDGRRHEVLMKEDGTVVGHEEELAEADWPKDVVAAADKAVPDGKIVIIEKVQGLEAGGPPEYHVKKEIDGEQQRISVSMEGAKVGRILRKINAEFRVPRK